MSRALILALLTAFALAGCRRDAATSTTATSPAVPVRVANVASESVPVLIEAPATVRPAERASIAAKLTGTVATFPWGLGQSVAAGEVLLTLSVPEIEARVHQTQAQLAEAERAASRQKTLVSTGVNPVDSLRDAEDRLHFVQAATAEAEAQLAYATVRAPFAGVITEKNVLPGDLATPGLPLLVLESTQRLRAEGTVPEKVAANLKPGDTMNVLLDDAESPVTGTLEEISASADAVSRSVLVKVALPAGPVRSGQFARLQIAQGTTEALLVPVDAVTRFGQMERVFVAADGHALLRLVKTGRASNGRVEILSGLNPGEKVVLAPPAALRDGQPVTFRP